VRKSSSCLNIPHALETQTLLRALPPSLVPSGNGYRVLAIRYARSVLMEIFMLINPKHGGS
jgi:hypothetical protein